MKKLLLATIVLSSGCAIRLEDPRINPDEVKNVINSHAQVIQAIDQRIQSVDERVKKLEMLPTSTTQTPAAKK